MLQKCLHSNRCSLADRTKGLYMIIVYMYITPQDNGEQRQTHSLSKAQAQDFVAKRSTLWYKYPPASVSCVVSGAWCVSAELFLWTGLCLEFCGRCRSNKYGKTFRCQEAADVRGRAGIRKRMLNFGLPEYPLQLAGGVETADVQSTCMGISPLAAK